MKRPRNHIIQNISNKAFAAIIPDEWVARELDQDYGLDFMVEIFAGGESTSKIFFVQVKGTDIPSTNGEISYQVKRAHLDYYNPIPNPILFVIYSTKERQFWAIWANNLKGFLKIKTSNQKSSLLTLSADYIIDKSYFDNLPNIFSSSITSKLSLASSCGNKFCELYHKKLTSWLENFYPDVFTIEHHQVTQSINFQYNIHTEGNFIELKIQYLNSYYTNSEIDISDKEFLFLPVDEFNSIHPSIANPLFYLGLLLVEKNLKASLALTTRCLALYEGEIAFENLMALGKKSILQGEIKAFQKFIQRLISVKRIEDAKFANFCLFTFTSLENRGYYRENILSILDQTFDSSIKGMLNYNLANAYMINGDFYEASQHYQYARKLEPDYLNRHYWWREYGGVLFSAGHFKYAEWFYSKSIELGADKTEGTVMHALLADCQFFQGRFSDAEKNFEVHINHSDSSSTGFLIKYRVCQFLIASSLETERLDRGLSRLLVEEFLQSQDIDKLSNAIEVYPLNGIAWFNYGVFLMNDNQSESAQDAFLVTVCIQDWDEEAWTNCIFLALNLRQVERMAIIFDAAIGKLGIGFVNHLAECIYNDKNIPEDKKLDLIKAFHKAAAPFNNAL